MRIVAFAVLLFPCAAFASPPTGDVPDFCDVTVSGDVKGKHHLTGDVIAFFTEHWTDEKQRRELAEKAAARRTPLAEREQKVKDLLADKQTPIGLGISLVCNTPTVGIQFIPQLPGATLLNMPLAPKKYRVVKNFMAQPGDFGVLASSETGIADVDVGALELTRFDRQRVEGSFSFDGVLSDWKTGKMQMISVTGRFSFSCRDSAVCTK